MSRTPSLCGVILAAGSSTRMGTDKALLPWPPTSSVAAPARQTFLSAAIHALAAWTELVIVVAGNNQAALAPVVYANGAFLVVNPGPARGQFSSLQVGLQDVLNRGRDAALVTLVDRPPAAASTVEKLRDAFATALAGSKWAVVPEYAGKHGHPVIVGREMIEKFLRAPVAATARDVEHENQERIAYIGVDDPFVTMNVDTPQDYASLSASGASQHR
jgi:molybdenum cofactor cytidylyltransferase